MCILQLNQVERYSTETDEWQSVGSLIEPRSAMSVVAMASKLYAIGKHNFCVEDIFLMATQVGCFFLPIPPELVQSSVSCCH